MPGFLYFLNNAATPPRKEELGPLGLAHAFSKVPEFAGVSGFHCGEIKGLNGIILFDSERVEPGRASFLADRQTWMELPGANGKIFVGVDNQALPTPGDLQRVNMLPGTPVELGDERIWIVPIARSWKDGGERVEWDDQLPRAVKVLPDGRWGAGQVVPRYRELWEIGDIYVSVVTGSATKEEVERLEHYGVFSAAAIILSANYLVGPAECSLLGLLNTQNAFELLDALIQRRDMDELAQKKMTQLAATAQASLPSSAGREDSTQVTAPPILT